MPSAAAELREVRLRWPTTHRIVASKLPPVDLYERVAAAEDFAALHALESLKNPRLDQRMWPRSLELGDAVFGEGAAAIMAPFCYASPHGSRFSAGGYGVYYAARDVRTAIHECGYHFRRFMRDGSGFERVRSTKRLYLCKLAQPVLDGRKALAGSEIMNPDPGQYAAAQAFGADCRERGAWGLAYPSVRHDGGECVAVFRPKALRPPAIQAQHYEFLLEASGEVLVRELGAGYVLAL